MNTPVDLTNLRSMTDGDAGMEKALFEEFISSFEAGIKALEGNVNPEAAEAWRKQAHSLKGTSLSLGAMALGELCKRGQDEAQADASAKNALLKDIKAEYEKVRRFLEALPGSS